MRSGQGSSQVTTLTIPASIVICLKTLVVIADESARAMFLLVRVGIMVWSGDRVIFEIESDSVSECGTGVDDIDPSVDLKNVSLHATEHEVHQLTLNLFGEESRT